MKKSFLMQILVLLTLTSATFAQAQSETVDGVKSEERYIGIEENNNDVAMINEELVFIVSTISNLSHKVGLAMEDSQGYLKALGEKHVQAIALKEEFDLMKKNLSEKSQEEINGVLSKGGELLKDARITLKDARDLAEQAKQLNQK